MKKLLKTSLCTVSSIETVVGGTSGKVQIYLEQYCTKTNFTEHQNFIKQNTLQHQVSNTQSVRKCVFVLNTKIAQLSKPKFNSIELNLRLDNILTERSTHHPTHPPQTLCCFKITSSGKKRSRSTGPDFVQMFL